MPTYNAQAGQVVMIDPADDWVIVAPPDPTNDTRFFIRTITESIWPIELDWGTAKFEGNVVTGMLFSWPESVVEFVYSAGDNSWYINGGVPIIKPYLSIGNDTWAPGSITAAWTPVDLSSLFANKYMVHSPPTNFQFSIAGVYRIAIAGAFANDTSNSGRTTRLRLIDADSYILSNFGIFTGRNAEGTSFAFESIVTLGAIDLTRTFRFDIGGVDGYSQVSFTYLRLNITALDVAIALQI